MCEVAVPPSKGKKSAIVSFAAMHISGKIMLVPIGAAILEDAWPHLGTNTHKQRVIKSFNAKGEEITSSQ